MKIMSIIRNMFSCISKQPNAAIRRRPTKVKFDVRIADSFKTDILPSQIKDMLVYIAREGVAVTDLFRRPGNPQDMKKIIHNLKSGTPINWTEYNFYTLANVAKRFLLSIDGGLMGAEAEEKLVSSLELPDDQSRIEAMHSVIMELSSPVQQLLSLLFGTWFRMIYHTEVNAMSVEAVAKSVTGSVFPSCTCSLEKVERASKVMEYLITGFASADLFGQELIEYFTRVTKTSISRIEKFKYEFRYPSDVPRAKSVRLFVRMLLEEGKKHGFDILQHAVTKEVFEATQTIPTVDSASQDKIVAQTSEKRTQVTTDEDEVSHGPVQTSTPGQPALLSRLNLTYQNSPILMHRLSTPARMLKSPPEEIGEEDNEEMNNPDKEDTTCLEEDDYQVDYILHTPAATSQRQQYSSPVIDAVGAP